MNTRHCLLLLGLASLALAAMAAVPTNNVAAGLYPEGYPAWTDGIKWANVIDMSAYAKGKTNFEKFEAARDELAAKGGGVLYYPAGVYDFSDGPFDGPNGRGLMLKSGVVIRGDAPRVADPTAGKLELGTRFVFGFADRSAVAVDTGTRARFLLRRGFVAPQASDIVLSVAVNGDALGTEAFGRLTDRVIDPPLTGTVARADAADGETITATLASPVVLSAARPEGTTATYTLTVKRDGARFTGTYTGDVNGVTVKGEVIGQIATVKAETPRDWNIVGLCPEPGKRISDVRNVGIAFVHLVGATVYFGPDVKWGATWKTAGSWKSAYVKDSWAGRVPDGTHPNDPFNGGGNEYIGSGSGRMVLGCVLEDAAVVNNSMTCGVAGNKATPEHVAGFGVDGFYMAKFPARIAAYGADVFVAGNVLPKPTDRNFVYWQRTTRDTPIGGGAYAFQGLRQSPVLFDYGKVCGIDVNKEMLGLTKASITGDGSAGYYPEDVVVRDNYVYNNGHKGYNLSGAWLTVANNVNDRDVLVEGVDPYGVYGWRLTLDGFVEANAGGPGQISDNLARAFDMGGQNVWIDGNRYWNTGSVPGNDGEGILCQTHGGTSVHAWAFTHNIGTHTAAARGSEKGSIWTYDADLLGALWGWNTTEAKVGAWKHATRQTVDVAFTGNKCKEFGPPPGSYVETEPAPVTAPTNVTATRYQDEAVRIAWKDTTTGEVGFRVERKVADGPWQVIAYRPPQIQTHADNPPCWIDFLAPSGKPLAYRVAAINGKDDETGASQPTAPLTLPKP